MLNRRHILNHVNLIVFLLFICINFWIFFRNNNKKSRKNLTMEEGPDTKSRFKRVCVFCGSSEGKKDCYREVAILLGQEMAAKKLDLVYGGGNVGLMGFVAQAVRDGGGNVLGVMPKPLLGKEITGETVGDLRIVANMHQRKAEMSRNCDCYIALPGGYGTMEEVLEVITWAQLGIHTKPVGLLNVDGYYDWLLSFIDRAAEEGFIRPIERHIFVSAPNAKELVQKLEEYVPVVFSTLKWDTDTPLPQLQQQSPPPSPPPSQPLESMLIRNQTDVNCCTNVSAAKRI